VHVRSTVIAQTTVIAIREASALFFDGPCDFDRFRDLRAWTWMHEEVIEIARLWRAGRIGRAETILRDVLGDPGSSPANKQ